MKKTVKTKKVKPAFTVDLTHAEDSSDAMLAFADARFEAGIPLKEKDYDIIVYKTMEWTMDTCIDTIFAFAEMIEAINLSLKTRKKLPWYKRFWKWITKPFRKSK